VFVILERGDLNSNSARETFQDPLDFSTKQCTGNALLIFDHETPIHGKRANTESRPVRLWVIYNASNTKDAASLMHRIFRSVKKPSSAKHFHRIWPHTTKQSGAKLVRVLMRFIEVIQPILTIAVIFQTQRLDHLIVFFFLIIHEPSRFVSAFIAWLFILRITLEIFWVQSMIFSTSETPTGFAFYAQFG
jgi:hypothetical protein